MSTVVWNSAWIKAPKARVWALLRPLNFAYLDSVSSAEYEEKGQAGVVGSTVKVTYSDKDKTVQRVRLTELSDAENYISWELVSSEPKIQVMSISYTVKLSTVTSDHSTFIQWTTRFSSDAKPNVRQDAKYKQQDHFAALARKTEQSSVTPTVAKVMSQVVSGMLKVVNKSKKDTSLQQLTGAITKEMQSFTSTHKKLVSDMWDKADTNGDGTLDKKEVASLVDSLLAFYIESSDELAKVISAMMKFHPAIMSVEENEQKGFVDAVVEDSLKNLKALRDDNDKTSSRIFNMCDKNSDGKIDKQEFMGRFLVAWNELAN